jgi:RimJ/RimL family protein N-acetyltransferase
MAHRLVTERLVLRGWTPDDAAAALGAYGDAQVARWLAPAMDVVPDQAAMRLVLQQWVAEDARMITPAGRWAIELSQEGRLVGGATLLPLPPDEEFEVGWQLHPQAWGNGYATEAGLALARWAFEQGIEQVIALVRPANTRAEATVRRIGMEWVGETEKYHGLRLQEYRLRPGDLTAPGRPSAAEAHNAPGDPAPGAATHRAADGSPRVTDDQARSRFELRSDGRVAELVYRRNAKRLVLLHTGVPSELAGRGLGGRLVTAAIDRAAREGMTVVPLCPFARGWLERHPGTARRANIDWG